MEFGEEGIIVLWGHKWRKSPETWADRDILLNTSKKLRTIVKITFRLMVFEVTFLWCRQHEQGNRSQVCCRFPDSLLWQFPLPYDISGIFRCIEWEASKSITHQPLSPKYFHWRLWALCWGHMGHLHNRQVHLSWCQAVSSLQDNHHRSVNSWGRRGASCYFESISCWPTFVLSPWYEEWGLLRAESHMRWITSSS